MLLMMRNQSQPSGKPWGRGCSGTFGQQVREPLASQQENRGRSVGRAYLVCENQKPAERPTGENLRLFGSVLLLTGFYRPEQRSATGRWPDLRGG